MQFINKMATSLLAEHLSVKQLLCSCRTQFQLPFVCTVCTTIGVLLVMKNS